MDRRSFDLLRGHGLPIRPLAGRPRAWRPSLDRRLGRLRFSEISRAAWLLGPELRPKTVPLRPLR